MSRPITHHYRDPLDEIWLHTAAQIGFTVKRSGEVYAHSDGRGTLVLAETHTFDPDDSLAQLILHELCHAMVEGERSWTAPDWGLDNISARDEPREHAALRLQAELTSPLGLRWVLAPTTDFRPYYDALGEEPLAGEDPAAVAAREGFLRSQRAPFAPALALALSATAEIVRVVGAFVEPSSVFARFRG